VDINGDKKLDIISGGAEGFVYSMTALENGQYTKPERMIDKSGKFIHLGDFFNEKKDEWDKDATFKHRDVCLHPVAVDWDNDGDLDLLLSGHGGLLAVRINEGDAQKAVYSDKNTYIMIFGAPFSTGKGTNARFVDWDGDGLKDLVCGVHQLGVVWLKNKGTKRKPTFELPKSLVSVDKGNPNDPYLNITTEVTDLNGDGKQDLIVGALTSGKKAKIWVHYRK